MRGRKSGNTPFNMVSTSNIAVDEYKSFFKLGRTHSLQRNGDKPELLNLSGWNEFTPYPEYFIFFVINDNTIAHLLTAHSCKFRKKFIKNFSSCFFLKFTSELSIKVSVLMMESGKRIEFKNTAKDEHYSYRKDYRGETDFFENQNKQRKGEKVAHEDRGDSNLKLGTEPEPQYELFHKQSSFCDKTSYSTVRARFSYSFFNFVNKFTELNNGFGFHPVPPSLFSFFLFSLSERVERNVCK